MRVIFGRILIVSSLWLAGGAFATVDALEQVSASSVDLAKDSMTMNAQSQENFYFFAFHSPRVGAEAPSLSLQNLEGNTVDLKSYRGKKPVMLVFGSASCFVYRKNAMEGIEKFRKQSQDKIEVLVVYTIEAHPAGGDASPYTSSQWVSRANVEDKVLVRQPGNMAARIAIAEALAHRHSLDRSKLLIDSMDNETWKNYGSLPNSLFLIDKAGKIFFKESWTSQSRDVSSREPSLVVALKYLLNK